MEIGQTPYHVSQRDGEGVDAESHLAEGPQTNVVTLGLVAVSLLWVAGQHGDSPYFTLGSLAQRQELL